MKKIISDCTYFSFRRRKENVYFFKFFLRRTVKKETFTDKAKKRKKDYKLKYFQ
jgi:hypothetical protein